MRNESRVPVNKDFAATLECLFDKVMTRSEMNGQIARNDIGNANVKIMKQLSERRGNKCALLSTRD
jgi:hypothetical protein